MSSMQKSIFFKYLLIVMMKAYEKEENELVVEFIRINSNILTFEIIYS